MISFVQVFPSDELVCVRTISSADNFDIDAYPEPCYFSRGKDALLEDARTPAWIALANAGMAALKQ